MRKLNNYGKITIGALVVVTTFAIAGVGYLFVRSADALALQNRKDTLGTSAPAIATSHSFVFTTQTALTSDATTAVDYGFFFQLPNAGTDPFTIGALAAADVTVTCTACGAKTFNGIVVTLSDSDTDTKNDAIRVDVNDTLQNSSNLPVASVMTVTIDNAPGITSPAKVAAAGTADIWTLNISTREDGSATNVDGPSAALVATIEGVSVTASVAESMTFTIAAGAACAGDTGTPTGITATATTVPFGTISPDTFKAGCQDLTLSTNASSGYIITAQEGTSLKDASTSQIISDTTCDTAACTESTGAAWATATANQGLGYWCENITGTPCAAAGDTTAEHRQFACLGVDADCNPGTGAETAQTVMTGVSPVSANKGRVHYKLSVSSTQAAGSYANTITYIATGTF